MAYRLIGAINPLTKSPLTPRGSATNNFAGFTSAASLDLVQSDYGASGG